jgi:hypothetical protein
VQPSERESARRAAIHLIETHLAEQRARMGCS